MKRKLCLLLALLLLAAGLASCNSKSEKTFVFQKGNVTIAVDAEAAPILASLGAYKNYDATPSCMFAGEDKIYVYDGFKLQTYQKTAGGADFVHSLILTDDTYTTPEGIGIGSTVDRVLEVYGTPDDKTDAKIAYTAKGMSLLFLTREGRVTSIQYNKMEANAS